MRRSLRLLVPAVLAGLLLSGVAAAPANAAPTATVMVKTQRMSAATLNATLVGWYEKGTKVTLTCWSRGQSVKGYYSPWLGNGGWDNLWYKTSDGTFTADVDLNTGTNNVVGSECGATTPPPPTGACTGFTGAKSLGSYTVAGVSLTACGPRPDWDAGASLASVRPYSGAPNYYAGYQCVELSARYLKAKYGVGSVTANGAQVVDNYAKANSSKFTVIGNGTKNNAPRAGDVLSLSGNAKFSDYGHTGVVLSASVDASGNGSIRVVEQNYGGATGAQGYHDYTVKAWVVQYAALPYIKWLRAK